MGLSVVLGAFLLIAFALSAGHFGDSASSAGGTAQLSPPSSARRTYSVSLNGRGFEPSCIDVEAGVDFDIFVRNDSTMVAEFENLALRIEKVLAPGTGKAFRIRGLEPGTYEFVNDFNPLSEPLVVVVTRK